MKRENLMKIIPGALVFVSALLGYVHHPYWLFFTMFVGLNMFQWGFTNWCLMDKLLQKMGFD